MTFSNKFLLFVRRSVNISRQSSGIKYIFPSGTIKDISGAQVIKRHINTGQSKYNSTKNITGQKIFENYGNSQIKNALIVSITSLLIGAEFYRRSKLTIYASENNSKKRIIYEPTRKVKNHPLNKTGLQLTLYQYENCPFCCKVRSMLDYYGIAYDVIEVETLKRSQLKWSSYRKVPLLVLEGVGADGFTELGDSTMSLSLLETILRNPAESIERIISFYPIMETKDKNGKITFEFPNKYFVMHEEKSIEKEESKLNNEERKWRLWNDDVLMHVISPNLYRTVDEARQCIVQFSKAGNWEQINGGNQYMFIMKLGPYAMWLLGKKLKSKYNLKPDVRHSLYDACNQWTKALGDKTFMGGDRPNLADISVYGTIRCMEGCPVFNDVKENTKIMKWYSKMDKAIKNSEGVQCLPSRVM